MKDQNEQRKLSEINRPMNEELFNNLEKQYQELAKVKAESEQIEKQAIEEMRKDLVEIFDEEYEKRRIITADFTAIKMVAKGYRKQSDGELTRAHIEAHYEAICALADMVNQFGYSTTFRKQKAVCDGGLSALEYAFGALQDCGCKINSNGTITIKNLWAFYEEFYAKMKGGE